MGEPSGCSGLRLLRSPDTTSIGEWRLETRMTRPVAPRWSRVICPDSTRCSSSSCRLGVNHKESEQGASSSLRSTLLTPAHSADLIRTELDAGNADVAIRVAMEMAGRLQIADDARLSSYQFAPSTGGREWDTLIATDTKPQKSCAPCALWSSP
jgi:hypothetical protein